MKSGARLVILSMAWLTTFPEEVFLEEYKGKTPECETFRYWIMRMWPLIVGDEADKDDEDRGMRIVVFANRCGIERGSREGMDDAVYAGSSCVIGIQALSPGEHRGEKGYAYADVSVWGMLGATEEGSLLVDTEDPPTWTFRVTRKLGAESEEGVGEREWIS
ncbi:Carbon-nitrogen hydrolase [Ascosphaera atra]|nr:Carbon-nitrogen hydrolase [Ascosphaera atra]